MAPLSEPAQGLVLERLHQLHPDVAEWKQEKKKIGRHAGSVFVAGDLRYFVKQQGFCLRTIYVYHLLAALGCGPQQFFVLACRHPGEDAFDHIVATRAVPHFRMASQQSEKGILAVEDAMCLFLLVCFFGLGDIPSNTDNWGTTAHGHLAIVDFSFVRLQGLHAMMPMLSLRNFLAMCRPFFQAKTHESDPMCMASFMSAYNRWFGSAESFAALLDDAMNKVIDWVNDEDEWREQQSILRSFELLEELTRFQRIATKQFESFVSWRNSN